MKSHRSLPALCVSIAVALGASAAAAADLPTKKAPLAPPVDPGLISWTGFFLGLQGGYAWDGEQVVVPLVSSVPYSVERHGGFGGLVGGYNYQMGNVVVGLEAEYNLASITGGAAIDQAYVNTNKVSGFGSVDAKLGYAFNRLLIYGVGGVGFLDVMHTMYAPYATFGRFTAFEPGYTVGGGVQYAFTPNWSGFFEYRYYNSGSKDFAALPIIGPHHTVESLSNVRFGVVYRFGG